jgi:hypothetical protein
MNMIGEYLDHAWAAFRAHVQRVSFCASSTILTHVLRCLKYHPNQRDSMYAGVDVDWLGCGCSNFGVFQPQDGRFPGDVT